jgi:hypothetical protein
MSIRRNPCVVAAVEMLEEKGIRPSIERGGKHIKIRFSYGGRTHLCVVSLTPSCRFAADHVRGDLRRIFMATKKE